MNVMRLAIRKIGGGRDFENIDARLRKRLLRAQQRLSLAALLEPNSTGDSDSENRWRNGFRKYRCAMAKALAHSATAFEGLAARVRA